MPRPTLPTLPRITPGHPLHAFRWAFPLLVAAGQALLWSLESRGQSHLVLLGFGVSTIGWVGTMLGTWNRRQLLGLVGLGFALRAIWLFVPPLLSDDWYRYLWDGLVAFRGANPFDALPSQMPAFAPDLLAGMNSPDYYTVYPPAAQGLFRLAAELGGGHIPTSLQALRGMFLAFDGLALFLLWRLTRGGKAVLVYALAPLAIAETAGNVHLEGVSIAGVLLAVWAWQEGLRRSQAPTTAPLKVDREPQQADAQPGAAWLWYGLGLVGFWLAVATKLTPLMLLPLFPALLGWKRGLALGTASVALLVLSFLPFWNADMLPHLSSSLDLYYRRFEFNGGLYAAARWLSIQCTGYNRIDVVGPMLGLVSTIAMLLVAVYAWVKARPGHAAGFLAAAFGMVAIHQLTATIVHPWYLLPLLAYSCFSRWRFGLFWAALVPVTYMAYQHNGFHHPHAWTALEYGMVWAVLLAEALWSRKPTASASML